jgi:opacity protein-like surface antigen
MNPKEHHMNLHRAFFALCLILASATHLAYAQDDSPVQWQVWGGANVPTGKSSSLLQTGWNFGTGVTFRQPDSPFGLRVDFSYAANNATSHGLYEASSASGLSINGGWADVWSLTANGEYRVSFSDSVRGYVIAGIGAYYTQVQLTEVGYGYVCNPWWGYCYVGTGNTVVASNSSTHFGWNAGLGVDFKLQSGKSLFVEARYTWIDTPHPTIEYIPIVFGVRF